MRPFFVVVFALMLRLFLRVCKAHEPVGVSLVEARKSYGLTQRFCGRNATIRDCRNLRGILRLLRCVQNANGAWHRSKPLIERSLQNREASHLGFSLPTSA
jgi:hypothetical protein